MKYVSNFGALWKLSDKAYVQLLKDAIAGKEWNLYNYGPKVADEVTNTTDMLSEEARYHLMRYRERKQKARKNAKA